MYPKRKFPKEERSSGRFVFHPCKIVVPARGRNNAWIFCSSSTLNSPPASSSPAARQDSFSFPAVQSLVFLTFPLLQSIKSGRSHTNTQPSKKRKQFFRTPPIHIPAGEKFVRENKHIVYVGTYMLYYCGGLDARSGEEANLTKISTFGEHVAPEPLNSN